MRSRGPRWRGRGRKPRHERVRDRHRCADQPLHTRHGAPSTVPNHRLGCLSGRHAGNRRWMGTTSRRFTVTVSSSPRRAARPPTISPPVSSSVHCWRWLWSPQRLEAQFCGPWATLAGGSLVAPSVPCTLLTPIAPHSLAARPFIVPESSRVVVTLPESAKHGARATLDGRTVRAEDSYPSCETVQT